MGYWLVVITLFVAGEDQADVPEASSGSQAAIVQAVQQLGSREFSQRRHASRFLWQQGLAAEPALRRALQDPDREIRLRAQLILEDFRYGILPGVPEEVNDLIRQFRSGDSQQRLASLQSLADRDDFERLQHLIRLEPDSNIRRTLLVYLMRNPRAIERFLQLERLEELIVAVGADQDVAWRQTTLAQMVFSEWMIRRLSERGELQVLVNIVQRESSAEVRREMLSRLFENAAAVASLVEHDQLDLLLKLTQMEPQRRVRSQWILQMVASPQTLRNLVERGQFERFLEFARQNAEADQQAAIVQRAVQHPDVVQAIVTKSGVDGLIALSKVENDPGARGTLLATIVASAAVRQALNVDGQRDLILQLAAKQDVAAMRNQYMKGILASGYGYSLFQEPASREALWKLIEFEPPETDLAEKDWRGEAVFRLLTMSSGHEMFREEAELKWLLEFLDSQVTDEQRLRLLQRVLTDYRLQRVLNGIEYFELLLPLVKRTPDDQRGVLLGRLIAMTTVQRLAEADQMGRVIALARDETVPEVRAAYLENLFRNQAAMASLIAGDQYDQLWQLLTEERDAVRHASLRGDFYSTSAVLSRLQEQDQLDTLVEFARQQTDPEARHQYLVRLFGNQQAMSLLMERDHYQALDGMAREETDENRRTALLSVFYVSPLVLQRLAADRRIGDVLEFAEHHLSGNDLRSFLQQICQHEPNIAAFVDQGHLDRTVALIMQQTQEHQQAYLMRLVLASPRVVAHYGSQGRLKDLFATVSAISVNTRHQVWDSLLQRAENLQVILKHDGLDDLLAQIDQEPQAPRRGLLLGRLLTHASVIEHWVAGKGVSDLFRTIDAQRDVQARQNLLRTLFASEPAVEALLGAGAFEELYDVALRESDEHQRSQLLAQLLTNPRMVKHLVAADRIDRLIQIAGQQGDVEVRRHVLSQILGSSSAVDALIDGGYLDQLLKLCRLDFEASARRQLLVTLLESRRAVEHLADAEELESILREILGETEEDARRSFVHSLLSRREILPIMIDRGLFDELLKAADAEQDPNERRLLLLPLLNHAGTVRELARLGRMPEMIQLVTEEIQASGNSHLLYGLFANPAAVQALIVAGGFEQLLDWTGREEGRAHGTQLLVNLWNNPTTIAALIEHGHLDRLRSWMEDRQDINARRQLIQLWLYREEAQASLAHREVAEWLVQLLSTETEEGLRRSYAISLLNNSRVRQHLVANGHAEFLREALDWLPDESLRQLRLRDLITAPSGLVAHHRRRGEHELAERLLEEQAHHDLGRLWLASYWWTSGRIEERIEAVRQQSQADSDPSAMRQLVYLHRANGDLASAYRLAQELDDPGLQLALLVEMRHWAEAAVLQPSDPCPLPIPWTHSTATSPAHRQIEQLGLTAAYQRLAGEQAAFARTIRQIVETAATEPDNHTLQWLCVETLLLNDQVEEGLEHLAGYDPGRAFGLLALQHRYHDALQLLGWQEGKTLDKAWIAALPTRGSRDEQRVVEQVESALKVIRLLHQLGRRDEALEAAQVVEATSREQPDESKPNSPRSQCLEQLVPTYLALGQPQRAWELAAETIVHPHSPPPVLTRLYGSRSNDAQSWWIMLQRLDPSRTPHEAFAQLHDVLSPSGKEPSGAFESLVQQLIRYLDANEVAGNEDLRAAVARVCLRRGQPELAARVLRDADPHRVATLAIRADIAWHEQRWSEAAEYFEQLWQTDHDRLADLYLAGECLRRAGLEDEAEQRVQLAHQLAIDSRARFQMARQLLDRGLREQAAQQCRIVLRTAPPGHLEWHEATRLLGEHLMDDQPGAAADWFDLSILDDLRPYFHLIELTNYLRTPALIHRLRAVAAIEANDAEAAQQRARQALAAVPAETQIAEDLVPRLDAAGHRQAADRLFDEQFQAHVRWCEDWPDSAMLNNNLAWLAARCGRRLEEALHHAQRAVELEPNAAHLDTLAEVHFRLGNREKAIEYSQRAVSIDPGSDTLRKQLQRFRAAP
jgi:tetratricopeptide (TPR) repeat protein